jgi:hypothetical protein
VLALEDAGDQAGEQQAHADDVSGKVDGKHARNRASEFIDGDKNTQLTCDNQALLHLQRHVKRSSLLLLSTCLLVGR